MQRKEFVETIKLLFLNIIGVMYSFCYLFACLIHKKQI